MMLVGCSQGRDAAPPPPQDAASLEFTPLTVQTWTLPNGLSVYFLEDREIPIVRGTLYMRGGSLWETKDGAAEAMGALLRSGGAGAFTGDEVDEGLERLAAGISTTFGSEFGSANFSCLSSDLEEVMSLLSGMLLKPRFAEKKLALWKSRKKEHILRRDDDPSAIAQTAFLQLLFDESPYRKVLGVRDVEALDRQDLKNAHVQFVRPNDAILAMTGDATAREAKLLTKKLFGSWLPRKSELPPYPPAPTQTNRGMYMIQKPFSQATIVMGTLGPQRLGPYHYEIKLFNRIFGMSGFGNRLTDRIRSDLGLAYVVYGGIAPGTVVGRNYIGVQTKSSTVAQAIHESFNVLQDMRHEPVKQGVLQDKKRAEKNSFVFSVASTDAQVQRKAVQTLLGYPPDYDDTFIKNINEVVAPKVQQAASTLWNPANMIVVVVGNGDAAQSLLELQHEEGFPLAEVPVQTVIFKNGLLEVNHSKHQNTVSTRTP